MNPNKKKTATELKELDVDRIDAVDRPATGRAFLLFKNKDGSFTKPGDVEPIVTAPVRKRAGYKFGCDMSSAIFGAPVAVAKDAAVKPAVRDFDGDDAQFRDSDDAAFAADDRGDEADNDRVNRSLTSWAGRVVDGTRRPLWGSDSFLHGDAEDPDGNGNVTQFSDVDNSDFTPVPQRRPDAPNFAGDRTDAGTFTPGDFRPPMPRAQRMGNGYVLRSAPRIGAGQFGPPIPWTTLALAARMGYDVDGTIGKRPAEEVSKATGRVSFTDVIFG